MGIVGIVDIVGSVGSVDLVAHAHDVHRDALQYAIILKTVTLHYISGSDGDVFSVLTIPPATDLQECLVLPGPAHATYATHAAARDYCMTDLLIPSLASREIALQYVSRNCSKNGTGE